MKSQLLRFLGAILVLAVPGALAQAQTNAACTFTFFQLSGTVANPQGNHAFGVNSYATVVGEGETSNNVEKGFIRYSNGSTSYYSNLMFAARNDNGVNVGTYTPSGSTPEGFMLKGSTLTTIKDPQSAPPYGTHATGINKWNSIVGWYEDSKGVIHGFKRFSNGSYVTLDYPGAQATMPAGLNDSGTIVGTISDSTGAAHGFIYSGGKWAQVDYPGTSGTTQLLGISNANVILGLSTSTESGFTFIDVNGTFKVISDAKAAGGVFANGIAANGLITGDAYMQSSIGSWNGFLASCK
jgi:hypothetical protein